MSSDETRENTPESSVEELIDEFLMEEGLINESLMQEIINEFLMEEGLIDESPMEEDLTDESPMEEDFTNEALIEEDLINESYWPRLREILLEDPSGMDQLGLECMICTMPMIIKPFDPSEEDNGTDHRAMILLCGHLVGFSCIDKHFNYREKHGLPLTCPFHVKPPLCHPECSCGHMGWPIPGKVEDFLIRPLTIAEGFVLTPKCRGCTIDDVFRCLKILTNIFVPGSAELLESFKVAYRVRVQHLIWGEFEKDERTSHEIELPFSMLQHYRSIESSLITIYSVPGQLLGVGDVEISLFEYDKPMEHGRVVRRKMRNLAQKSATSDQTTDETRQSM